MRIAALLFMLYIVLIKIAVGSIIIAFAGSASTIAYLILRKDVDGTEMDDVYTEENDEDAVAEDTVPHAPEGPVAQQATPTPEPIVPPEQEKPERKPKESTSQKSEKPETAEKPLENNGLSPNKQ
jgi:outer membrane biosynthesis protein TonB